MKLSLGHPLKYSVREVCESQLLSQYLIVFVGAHVLTLLFYLDLGALGALTNQANPICWPLVPNCVAMRIFFLNFWQIVFGLYFALAMVTALLWLKKFYAFAFYGLLSLFIIKFFIQSQDYRLVGNYHYIHHVLELIFLFFPKKTPALTLAFPVIYFFAGTIKLNPEWLTGAALPEPQSLATKLLVTFGPSIVVFLELYFAFYFLSHSFIKRWFVYFLACVFHMISYIWVGFFYPGLMLLFLLWYPLSWKSGYRFNRSLRQLPGYTCAFFVILFVGQLWSLLLKDSALFTHSRLFALNMFDARTVCFGTFSFNNQNKTVVLPIQLMQYKTRLHCDPIIVEFMAKNLCQEIKRSTDKFELQTEFVGKRSTDQTTTLLISRRDTCQGLENRSWLDWVLGRWPS